MMTTLKPALPSREKLKDVIHYVAYKSDPRALGAIKMNKVLWYSDLLSYLTRGHSITDAKYIAQTYGPVASDLMPAVQELQDEERVLRREMKALGGIKVDYLPLSAPNMQGFDGEDIDIISAMVSFVCDQHTAMSISQFSHDEIWKMAEIGEEISYKTIIAFRDHPITSEDVAWAKSKLRTPAVA